ncbi:MAG: hypothetical protein WBW44_09790, partial [Solirubrobacterales bacterium]
QGQPGKNAKVTCKVKQPKKKKKSKKVKVVCKVKFPKTASAKVSWNLRRKGDVVSKGKATARQGTVRIPARKLQKLEAGRYVLRVEGQPGAVFVIR